MRRLIVLVSAIVLVDTMLYAAIAPLLPYYSHRLHLSKAGVGVLVAAYPAGTLLGSLPGGWLAARAGVRPTVLLGLALMAGASLTFGLGRSAWLLDLARFAQGVGGAASWSGGLAWLVGRAPSERRGEMIGTAFGAAVGGALLGPVLGALARALGPRPVFGAVAVLGGALAYVAARTPAPPRSPAAPLTARALTDRRTRIGASLIVLVGLFFGTLEVLVPLRLGRLGAGAAAIAAVFLVSAAVQSLVSPRLGRWVDRSGWIPLTRLELCFGIVLCVTLPWLSAAWPIAVLAAASGVAVGGLWIPGMTLVSHGAEATGLDQAYAFALINLLWAAAQVTGAAGGSSLAQATGDALPYLLVGALFAVALIRSRAPARPRRSRRSGPGRTAPESGS